MKIIDHPNQKEMLTMSSSNSQMKNMIVFEGISKDYGGSTALHQTDLAVRQGEFLSLLGPSGSGKSTILNIIAGAIMPSTGRLIIEGKDVSLVPPRERGLGMVFQNYALLPHLNVFDNIAFPLRIRGMGKKEIQEKVGNALERVGLQGYENRKPREMSGGQQQRVGIARCIVYSPSIILMDEPLGALDKRLRDQLQGEIKRLHKDLGTTLVYVTHDQEEALNLSDRICLMNKGRIEQHGTPDELYFEPASTFVADFVGESNLFDAVVDDSQSAHTPNGMRIAIANRKTHPAGTKVKVLVRPEKMRVVKAGESGDNLATGIVKSVSFVGGMTSIKFTATNGDQVYVKEISDRITNRISVGDTISACWSATDSIVII